MNGVIDGISKILPFVPFKREIKHFIHIGFIHMMSLIKKHSYFLDNGGAIETDNDLADFIISKGYLPNDKDFPKLSPVKDDVTYLISKLTDEDIVKLLNQPKKNVYDLNDIISAAVDFKPPVSHKVLKFKTKINDEISAFENKKKRFQTVSGKDREPRAFFRLENKPVHPDAGQKINGELGYSAVQKLNNLLYSERQEDDSEEDEEKKELLFDVLVAHLKTLCCKKRKRHGRKKKEFKSILDKFVPQEPSYKQSAATDAMPGEYIFLVMNDEIKSNGSENDIISVDPDSLETNSSVLLLGPINTPLTDIQLKTVMSRISNELSKPDYIALLQQLSEGTLSGSNVRLMKSLINGPNTRRYIKPHRCNHQSPLAKIYGGPKWLICTGYLNLNTPSLYD